MKKKKPTTAFKIGAANKNDQKRDIIITVVKINS